MRVITIPLGPLSSNMYFLYKGSGIFLIDPSVEPDRTPEVPYKLDAIFITHGHFDHINALDLWVRMFPDCKVYMSSKDMICLKNPKFNCSYDFAEQCVYVSDVLNIKTADFKGLTVYDTPGHSEGSVCILFEEEGQKVMFTGDTVFAGAVGRCDLAGGSVYDMNDSIKFLSALPFDCDVYPGHGPSTTLDNERKFNPYF